MSQGTSRPRALQSKLLTLPLKAALAVFLIAFTAQNAAAQDGDGMEFSLDEVEGGDTGGGDQGSDGGEMTFDVIDTGAAAEEQKLIEAEQDDRVRVIQHRPFLRRERVEMAPFMGTNVNDALVSHFVAGASLNYHISEDLSLGLNGGYSLGSETDLFDKVIEDYELFAEVSELVWFAGLHFQYAPIYGKFTLFDTWIVPWDTYVLLGLGYLETQLGGKPMLTAGVGQRYFMNRYFTVNIELRNLTYNEDYPSSSELYNNLLFTAGVSFFLPGDFEYTTLR
ncbi:MAG: outer membrane beta-barrel domain-containing protein [Bradymonadia bacterium]